MKKKYKIIIAVSVVAVAGLFVFSNISKNAQAMAQVAENARTVTLQRADLANIVNVNGIVYSKESTNVYSTVQAPVKTIHVEVGDFVSEGDVLAELDARDLQHLLNKNSAALNEKQAGTRLSLETAKKDLENFQTNASNNQDLNLLKTEQQMKNAELTVESRGMDVYRARKQMTEMKDDYGVDSDEYKKAKDIYDDAQKALEIANSSYESWVQQYDATKNTVVESEDSLKTKVKSAEISNQYGSSYLELQKLREDIGKCVIKAPASGTITAVTAVEGASGAGLLFVIQDEENLKIIANIKEYDIGDVKIGDPVSIRSDALNGVEYEGILTKIAPTSINSAKGEQSIGDPEYQSEITIAGEKGQLRIGMNTKLGIKTEEKKNIFSVPYESVGTNEEDKNVVFVIETAEDGTRNIRMIEVTLGMENDLFSEIISTELEEGMELYREATEGQSAFTMQQAGGGKNKAVNASRAV